MTVHFYFLIRIFRSALFKIWRSNTPCCAIFHHTSCITTYRTVRIGVAYRLGTLGSADFLLGGVNRRKNDYQPFSLGCRLFARIPKGRAQRAQIVRLKSHSTPFLPKAKKEDSSFDESLVAGRGFELNGLNNTLFCD